MARRSCGFCWTRERNRPFSLETLPTTGNWLMWQTRWCLSGDLSNFSHVLNAVKQAQPRVIYHLGAMDILPSERDPARAIQTNAIGTLNVLEAARLFDVPQVLYTSSIGVFGSLGKDEWLNDHHAMERPSTIYGITKLFGQHLGLFYKNKYGLDFRGLRRGAWQGKRCGQSRPCH